MPLRPILAIALFALATSAKAASVEEAREYIDRVATVRCELIEMQYEVMGLVPESQLHRDMSAKMQKRATAAGRELEVGMRKLEADPALGAEAQQQLLQRLSAKIDACTNAALNRYRARVQAGTALPPAQR